MRYWVFTVGHYDLAPPFDWLKKWPHHVEEMWFPATKRPAAISAGDRAVMYGTQGKGFIAAVEVISHKPEPNEDEEGKVQFPWVTKHRLLAHKAADDNVASPEDAGLNPRRIARGPHTEINEDEYTRAVAVMLDAAARTAGGSR